MALPSSPLLAPGALMSAEPQPRYQGVIRSSPSLSLASMPQSPSPPLLSACFLLASPSLHSSVAVTPSRPPYHVPGLPRPLLAPAARLSLGLSPAHPSCHP